jgi:fimbrial chaperone protein
MRTDLILIRGLRLFLVGMLLFALSIQSVSANMLISPLRVLLDEDNRSATITLRNTSDGARTYRLEWVPQQMRETGGYRNKVDESAIPPAAGPMIRFSPRQITIGPGQNQTVRLSYRPPADLAPGEYRSHLKFAVLPDVSEPISKLDMGKTEEGLTMELDMQMSFTMPVIIRNDVPAPDVNISSIEVLPANQQDPLRLAITLERSGKASSIGNVIVEYQVDQNSPVQLIGRQGDVAIFTEVDRRIVTVPLGTRSIPSGAWVRVAYEGTQEFAGSVWDERVFRAQ